MGCTVVPPAGAPRNSKRQLQTLDLSVNLGTQAYSALTDATISATSN